MINGLKLSTEDFQPVTAYQVSHKGLKFIEQLEDVRCAPLEHHRQRRVSRAYRRRVPSQQDLKAEVDTFCYAPAPWPHELLQVTFKSNEDIEDEGIQVLPPLGEEDDDDDDDDDEEEGHGVFILMTPSKYARMSNVTDTEDVSYVSSPYLPACVRNPREQKAFSSNEHRADESATGSANIRDELDEAIVLSDVMSLVGEWIPFGANQIVALNERLGYVGCGLWLCGTAFWR